MNNLRQLGRGHLSQQQDHLPHHRQSHQVLWEFVAYVVMAALLSAAPAAIMALAEDEAICTADTECMAFCPPPADDPECDGGPQ